MKRIICFFKGHIPCSDKRVKEIEYAIRMFECDAWGSSAFSNMDRIKELRSEKQSCVRCGRLLGEQLDKGER